MKIYTYIYPSYVCAHAIWIIYLFAVALRIVCMNALGLNLKFSYDSVST